MTGWRRRFPDLCVVRRSRAARVLTATERHRTANRTARKRETGEGEAATFDGAAGEVRERPNRTVSKTVELQGSVGSNPTLSANSFKRRTQQRLANSPGHWPGLFVFWGNVGPDGAGREVVAGK